MGKYVRYYLVVKENSTDYRKIESDLPFSESEGKKAIMKSTPDAKKITYIAKKKAKLLLALNK